MSKENYQCGSCEQFFAAPDKEGECPHCGSGNWFRVLLMSLSLKSWEQSMIWKVFQ